MRLRLMILLGLAFLSANLNSCARNSNVVLLQSEIRPIILKGEKFRALWDGEVREFEAEADKIVIDKGSYIELIEEANRKADGENE